MISVIITAFREPVNLGKTAAHGDLLIFRDGDVIVAVKPSNACFTHFLTRK